jgi:hypothetical protein
MNVNLVDSKKKKLQPADILIVAAHQNRAVLETIKKENKTEGVSAERILHASYVAEIQDKSLIRMQENNTLFVLHPLPERVCVVRMFNGDTLNNLPNNLTMCFEASYKVGADVLIYQVESNVAMAFKQAFDKYQNEDKEIAGEGDRIIIVLGKQRP